MFVELDHPLNQGVVERPIPLLRSLERLDGVLELCDVLEHDVNPHPPAGFVRNRNPMGDPRLGRPAWRLKRLLELYAESGPSRFDDTPGSRLDPIRQQGHDLPHGPPPVFIGGQTVHSGQVFIDLHTAHVRIEEAHSDGNGVIDDLQPPPRLSFLVQRLISRLLLRGDIFENERRPVFFGEAAA